LCPLLEIEVSELLEPFTRHDLPKSDCYCSFSADTNPMDKVSFC
jgi:hypothetical protein